jgi:hypothetical protein
MDQEGNDCAILCDTKPLNILSVWGSRRLYSTFLHGAGLGHRKDFSNNNNPAFEVQRSLYSYVPWDLTLNSYTFCPHSVFVCFGWIWEQTAIIYLYNINWLVFITEREYVYCAVRTENLTCTNPTFCPQCICVVYMYLRTNSDYFPYNIKWPVLKTDTECVYCAVRTV